MSDKSSRETLCWLLNTAQTHWCRSWSLPEVLSPLNIPNNNGSQWRRKRLKGTKLDTTRYFLFSSSWISQQQPQWGGCHPSFLPFKCSPSLQSSARSRSLQLVWRIIISCYETQSFNCYNCNCNLKIWWNGGFVWTPSRFLNQIWQWRWYSTFPASAAVTERTQVNKPQPTNKRRTWSHKDPPSSQWCWSFRGN